MKKLLVTTALVGSMISGMSAANAATSISGNLAISYYATSNDAVTINTIGATGTNKSYNTFGTESQINFAASGDLNNGMKYAAGFSWEVDGTESLSSPGGATEGTYIEFIMGGTTLGLSTDRAGTVDNMTSAVQFAGFGYLPIAGIGTTQVVTNLTKQVDAGFGFNVRQKIGDGEFSFNYIPQAGGSPTQDIANGASKVSNDGSESAYEWTYTGKIAGADVKIGQVVEKKGTLGGQDTEGRGLSIVYPIGALKVGVVRGQDYQNSAAISNSTLVKRTTMAYGVGYAVNDNTSVGLTYAEGDSSSTAINEKIYVASLGYNLGAVAVQLQYKNAADIGGTSGADASQIGMYVSTKF